MPQRKTGTAPLSEIPSMHPYKLLPAKFVTINDPILNSIYLVCSVCECRLRNISTKEQVDAGQGYLCDSCHAMEKALN